MLSRFIVASALAGVVILACQVEPTAQAAPASDPSVGAAHQIVVVDPATGRLVSTPPNREHPEVGDIAISQSSTSHDGLVLQKSPVAGGGEMVDIRGRFRSLATVTVGADGRLHTDCGDAGTVCRDGGR